MFCSYGNASMPLLLPWNAGVLTDDLFLIIAEKRIIIRINRCQNTSNKVAEDGKDFL
jgi:hypothetical protein